MVAPDSPRLDRVFHALASATRRMILCQVARQELSVRDIAARHAMSLQAISKHLQILVGAGLIEQTREGRIKRCRANFQPLDEAQDYFTDARGFRSGKALAKEEG